MKILIVSKSFLPNVGGLENMMAMLAGEFSRCGHAVTVVTNTKQGACLSAGFTVVERPTMPSLVRLLRQHDIALHANVTLPETAISVLFGKRTVISHQTWYDTFRFDPRNIIKRAVFLFSTHVFCSLALKRGLRANGIVIGNSFDNETFVNTKPWSNRSDAFLFVGRLVSDKGCHVFIRAAQELRQSSSAPVKIVIVGDGPELELIKALIAEYGLGDSVELKGVMKGTALANEFNKHKFVVVPSLWAEPFGIVALEALACGCIVLASDIGGLPEACGPDGILFEVGNFRHLAAKMRAVVNSDGVPHRLRKGTFRHVKSHTKRQIARKYLLVFKYLARSHD